jgi:hypothetical protein
MARTRLSLRPWDEKQRVRQRDAHSGMILVIARALDINRLAVQQTALVGVEFQITNAEARFVPVGYRSSCFHFRHQCVKISLFERPQRRLLQRFSAAARLPGRWIGRGL